MTKKGQDLQPGPPWLALNPNYTQINVEEQADRPDSVLTYYKKLLALKKSPEYKETFTYGRFVPDYENKDGIFAYHRISGKDTAKAGCARNGKQWMERKMHLRISSLQQITVQSRVH